jgi:hypothetical protein
VRAMLAAPPGPAVRARRNPGRSARWCAPRHANGARTVSPDAAWVIREAVCISGALEAFSPLVPVRRRENLEEHVVVVGEGLDVDPAAVSA